MLHFPSSPVQAGNLFSASFRGAAEGREPGIHNPGASEYGFRVRELRSRPGMTAAGYGYDG